MLNRWEFHIHLIISPLMKDLPGLHLKLLRIPVKADKSLSIPSFISPISCHLAQQIHAVVTRSSSNISPNNLRFHQAHTESLNFPNDSMGLNIFNSPSLFFIFNYQIPRSLSSLQRPFLVLNQTQRRQTINSFHCSATISFTLYQTSYAD